MKCEPNYHRVGHIQFTALDGRKKILRTVHLRSYCFFLAFFGPKSNESEIDEFSSVFTSQSQSIEYISQTSTTANLTCYGVDAWDSFKGSRRKFASSKNTTKR